ncbi:MAG: VanZ family protein [Gammaproteobacteria bacterium]|nr:MAG: VanZ family protein [Gammaproteobacteria bacterium]
MLIWRALCLIQFFILLVIFTYLGLTPTPEESIPMFNDKLMHCSGYFVAGISISFAFPLRAFWQRAVFLILFSIGIEIGQHFMPPRTFDVYDICANSTGVVLGLLFIFLLTKNIRWFDKFIHFASK